MNNSDLILAIALSSAIVIAVFAILIFIRFKKRKILKISKKIHETINSQKYLSENQEFKGMIKFIVQEDVSGHARGELKNLFSAPQNWFETEIQNILLEIDKRVQGAREYEFYDYLYYLHLFYKKYASDDKSELSFLVSCLRKAASNESWIEITDMLLDGNKSLLSDMENIGNIISLWIRSDDKIKKNEFIIMNLSDIFFNSRKEFFAQNRDLPLKWQGLARDVKGELLSIRMQIQGNEDLRETIDDFISDLDSCLEGK